MTPPTTSQTPRLVVRPPTADAATRRSALLNPLAAAGASANDTYAVTFEDDTRVVGTGFQLTSDDTITFTRTAGTTAPTQALDTVASVEWYGFLAWDDTDPARTRITQSHLSCGDAVRVQHPHTDQCYVITRLEPFSADKIEAGAPPIASYEFGAMPLGAANATAGNVQTVCQTAAVTALAKGNYYDTEYDPDADDPSAITWTHLNPTPIAPDG